MEILTQAHFFNIEKVIQALAYIQRQSGDKSKLHLVKYLFFSDRIHIRKNLSLISKDNYYALKYGPVASRSLDLLNKTEEYFNYSDDTMNLLKKINIINKSARIIKETNTDLLSKNEMDSIDFAVQTFKGKPLVDISHEYPEWKRYEKAFLSLETNGEKIKMEDFFSNPDVNQSPCLKKYFNCDPLFENEDYLQEAKEFYFERAGLQYDSI
jgi:uncharacterized phage-associated protein